MQDTLDLPLDFTDNPHSGKAEKVKRRSVSIKEKLDIINDIEFGNKTKGQVSKERELARSTVNTIWNHRDKYRSAKIYDGVRGNCKRLRPSGNDEVDRALYKWWLHAKDKNVNISRGDLLAKAYSFSKSLGIQLKGKGSFIDRFKIKHGLVINENSEEQCHDYTDTMTDKFVKELPFINAGKEYWDIYCLNTVGLFYQVLPDENQMMGASFQVKSDQRVTLLLGSNMDGSDLLPPVIIGNSPALTNFENMESLSIAYFYNQNSFVTSQIWTDWIHAFDRKMWSLNRQVVLFTDMCPSSLSFSHLRAVNLQLMPTFSASFVPVRQGIFQRFKTWYRKLVLRDMADSAADGVKFQLDVLSSLHFIRKAWQHISQECVVNSFKVAGWSWDEQYGQDILSSERPPSLTPECLRLSMSESVFEEIDRTENSMLTREEITDQVILDSVASENSIYPDYANEYEQQYDGAEQEANLVNPVSKEGSDTDTVNVNVNGFQMETEPQKPSLSDAKNAMEVIQSFLSSVEDILPADGTKKRKRKKTQPKKRVRVVKKRGKIMCLNPENGVFEMKTVFKAEPQDIDLHMEKSVSPNCPLGLK